MVSIFNINSSNEKHSYGNIQRIGQTTNGRALYQVIDSKGNKTNKLSVPLDEAFKFESAYNDIIDSAPQIQNYVKEHSSKDDIKKRKRISQIIIGTFGITGAAVPIALHKTKSGTKKVLSTVIGIITGISAGYAVSLACTTPPGSLKFAKANDTFSRLDIQTIEE